MQEERHDRRDDGEADEAEDQSSGLRRCGLELPWLRTGDGPPHPDGLVGGSAATSMVVSHTLVIRPA